MSKKTGRIVMGSQIRAARSLLDWSREQLARAAGLPPTRSPTGSRGLSFRLAAASRTLALASDRRCTMPVSSSSATPSRAYGCAKTPIM